MMKWFYIILTTAGMVACGHAPEQIVVEVPALRASQIYDPAEVRTYIYQQGDRYKEIASSYSVKSRKIKDQDIRHSIYYMKRAITLYPSYELYMELITLFTQEKNYKEAAKGYGILLSNDYYDGKSWQQGYIFSAPDEDLVYESILTDILANDALYYYDLDRWNEMGFGKQKMRERLLSDRRFQYDTSGLVYKNIMLQFWTEEEVNAYKTSEANFNALLSTIQDTSSVFTIDKRSVQQFNYSDFNGMNYEEGDDGGIVLKDMMVYYLKEKQDKPDQWVQFNMNHYVRPNAGAKVVVYAVDSSATACPIEMRQIYHRLVVYDGTGRITDNKIIAAQCGEQLLTASYAKDRFELTEYKRTWKNPYSSRNFDNEIIRTELLSKKSYQINADGKIVEVTQASADVL